MSSPKLILPMLTLVCWSHAFIQSYATGMGNSEPTKSMESHGSPLFFRRTGSPYTTKGMRNFKSVGAMHSPHTHGSTRMLGEGMCQLKMAGTSKSKSCGHIGSNFSDSFNGATPRVGMRFTSSNISNDPFG